MNDQQTVTENAVATATEYGRDMEACVRRNPATSLLTAVGAGVVIALIVKALRPDPTPRERLMQMLEDLEDRVRDESAPAMRCARKFFSDSADVVNEGLHDGEARVEKMVRDASNRLRKLFS